MRKFKLQGVGIDTRTMKVSPGVSRVDDSYSYILTSIEANNDYIIRDFVENHVGEPAIITSTSFLDNIEVALKDHVNNLGKDHVDLLLLESSVDIEKYKEEIPTKNLVKHYGLIDPESLEQIEAKMKLLDVEYVALTISPLDFNLEIIEFCEKNNIKIIGLNPMGGYLSAARNIESFTVPYLLGFSATYSDIVMLSGRDVLTAFDDKWYLSELLDKEIDPKYILKKSISKPVKELKKAIYPSVSLEGEGSIVPYDDPQTLCIGGDGFRFNIGSEIEKVNYSTVRLGEEETEILGFIKSLQYPKDGDKRVKFAFARNKIHSYLSSKYPDFMITMLGIGNSVLVISLDKETEVTGALFWQKITPEVHRQFYLIFSSNIIFKEFVLSEEDEEKLIDIQ